MPIPADNARISGKTVTVAICGNPNCGKTTIFNAITGLRQQVGNYPGVTVEKTSGKFTVAGFESLSFNLLDIPGTYSLAAYSPDEYIAARALFGKIEKEHRPDVVVCVIDATNLERSLYFAFQVMQTGAKVVIALNMMDLLTDSGKSVDSQLLSAELGGIPVVPIVASKGRGIANLKRVVAESIERVIPEIVNPYGSDMDREIGELSELLNPIAHTRAELIRVLIDEDGPSERDFVAAYGEQGRGKIEQARKRLRAAHGSLVKFETSLLSRQAELVASRVLKSQGHRRRPLTDRIDSVVLNPLAGLLILGGLMLVMFQSIFVWAEPMMNIIDSAFGALAGWIGPMFREGPLQSLVIDGVIGGVGSVLIFLPQIIILFLFIAILEDSGYMPRAAFLVDRAFGWCGLSGKSFIPMLSSFACAVPGIMATRTIEDRRQRLLTIVVSPLMSCSARLPVYTIMIAAFIPHKMVWGFLSLQGLVLGSLYLLGMIMAIVIALLVRLFVFKQQRGSFLMEMPTYKRPTISSIAIRVYTRAKSFVLRAGTVIFAITIIIWALSYYPHSDSIRDEYAAKRVQIENKVEADTAVSVELAQINHEEAGAFLRDSYFGRLGRWVEPVFRPLGWDWKITMAALASFPAREVVIATLGTIYNLGSGTESESGWLVDKMRNAVWDDGPHKGQPVYTVSVALSVMVFFALCCQCGATLVTIRQETNSWWYPAIVFVYMTSLAYLGALVVYQVASRIWI